MDQRNRQGQLQADLCPDRADRRMPHRPFLSDLQKGIDELWVSGGENLDERADGCISEAELRALDGKLGSWSLKIIKKMNESQAAVPDNFPITEHCGCVCPDMAALFCR